LAAVWEGRGGMGKKKKEKQRKRMSAEGVYIMVFTDGITEGYIPSIKSSEKAPRHHTIAFFLTKCIVRRRYGRYIPTDIFHRYIPTVSPTELVRRYIPTDFETEFSPSVIPLVFSDFLVVIGLYLR